MVCKHADIPLCYIDLVLVTLLEQTTAGTHICIFGIALHFMLHARNPGLSLWAFVHLISTFVLGSVHLAGSTVLVTREVLTSCDTFPCDKDLPHLDGIMNLVSLACLMVLIALQDGVLVSPNVLN